MTDILFRFDLLSVTQCRSLEEDIIALHEACLLDIGRGEAEGVSYIDIVYPEPGKPMVPKLRPDPLEP